VLLIEANIYLFCFQHGYLKCLLLKKSPTRPTKRPFGPWMSGSYSEEGIGMDKNNRMSLPPRNATEPRRGNGRGRFHKKQENNYKTPNDYHTSKAQTNVTKISEKKPQRKENFNRHEREVDPDDLLGSNTVYHGGPKKKNLNHLLNFSFLPSERSIQEGYRRKGSANSNFNNKWSHGTVKFNKELFLQANCQFIVKDTGDYSLHTADPDTLVDWDYIEYVRIFMHEVPCCPICLYPPRAAKLTRCGHIYCWPCILHYLSLREEKTWMKCPICYEALHEKDLKSVETILTHTFSINEEITMNLMKKERGSTNAMKVSEWIDKQGQLFNVEDDIEVSYCKLLIASPEKLLKNLTEDQSLLEAELSECGADTLEGSFIDYAIKQLQTKISDTSKASPLKKKIVEIQILGNEISEICTFPQHTKNSECLIQYENAFDDITTSTLSESTVTEVLNPAHDNTDFLLFEKSGESSENLTSPMSNEEISENLTSPMSNEETSENLISPMSNEEFTSTADSSSSSPEETRNNFISNVKYGSSVSPFFYFYQADDGQHIYLNPVNAKCLLKEYGSWENCPATICTKIIELEYYTMNEEIRKRWRYLSHLPISCEFTVMELDLKPIVSKETYDIFSDQLAKRQRMRQKKFHEEKRFSNYVEERERKQMGYDSFVEVRSSCFQDILDTNNEDISSSQSFHENVIETSMESSHNLSSNSSNTENQSTHDIDDQQSKSFAQMLRQGKRIQSDVKARYIGTETVEVGTTLSHLMKETDEDNCCAPPQYQNSFGDAIQEAFNNLSVKQGSSKKKKNKREKTLLFSNHMARNSNM